MLCLLGILALGELEDERGVFEMLWKCGIE